ncbi:tetratricopeptide repeat protein [Qipengyuania sphaerica]|uniref:tetratricopeptide repeat protein n=1 Tax=Qipengyuania sphaerica TaxID=2867243 RepID=UPI001C88A99C|nr:hypothetical protein [Qipengyuania sphaerica]MBX7541297.1 hypothetical protein [Qipengyuania sphaerica]
MKPATTLALVALAASLGGCKSFVQAFDFSKHSSAPKYAIGPADLEEGRDHLRAGRFGNALAPLHRAALNPETRGEALNALGVAYAKIGRADLAERYFIAAARVDSGNERFAANLDRFYRSDLANDARLLFAQRERAREQFAAFTQSEQALHPVAVSEERMVTSGGQSHKITISRGATSQRVSRVADTPAITAAPASTPAPRVRVSEGTGVQQSTVARPAEISISTKARPASPRVRVGSAASTGNYPVRVRLPARTGTARGN